MRAQPEVRCEAADDLGLWGLFDGIGGLRQSCEWLGVPVAGGASVEIDQEAVRVVTSAWPDTFHVRDITAVTDQDLDNFHSRYPRINKAVVGMGAPCQDLSAANVGRRGLAGERSKLFWNGIEVMERLQRRFPYVDFRRFVEQVASARPTDVEVMSSALGLRPTEFDAALVSWVARPRLYWTDWEVTWPSDATAYTTNDRTVINFSPVRTSCKDWLRQGSHWQGEATGRPLRTFLRWIPRERPPQHPHGLKRCNEEELARWKASGYAASPAQFQNSNCIHDADGGLRMATMNEREDLLGFPRDHTLPAVKSGAAKSSPGLERAVRLSLCGNTWSVPATAFQLGSLFAEWGIFSRPPTVEEVVTRQTSHLLQSVKADPRHLPEGGPRRDLPDDVRLVLRLAAGCEHTGSDIRMSTGTLVKPSVYPRQEVPVHYWRWKTAVSFKWRRRGDHINRLECFAALIALERVARTARFHGCRVLHLLDSSTTIAVLTRRRSSSRRLHPVVRRVAALELATGIVPIYGFVRSAHNVADRPSRVFKRPKGRVRRARTVRHASASH